MEARGINWRWPKASRRLPEVGGAGTKRPWGDPQGTTGRARSSAARRMASPVGAQRGRAQ